jgi:hypothetical protein
MEGLKMVKGQDGMGSHKHGVSGHSGKSPKLRHHMRREAEKEELRGNRKRIIDPKSSVEELFHPKRN